MGAGHRATNRTLGGAEGRGDDPPADPRPGGNRRPAVAAAVEESPGRILAIAEAKTIEADLEGYRARLAEDARRTGVWLSRPRPGDLVDDQSEPGTRRLSSKLSAADAVEGDAMVDDVADALALHGDHDEDNAPTRDQLRAQAFASW